MIKMSNYIRPEFASLEPYVPGEQPAGKTYVKLNTNESPFPPAPGVRERAAKAAEGLNLYNDPDSRELTKKTAEHFGLSPECVLMTSGSDEILNFAFITFCGKDRPAVFPDVTYGFYKVFANVNLVPYEEIPVKDDLSIDYRDYLGIGKTIFIANPNAPTGKALPLNEIEEIVKSNPDNVVVIDEAYIDFGGESSVALVKKYDNVLVTQTFSKSRSMAGARLGMGIGSKELITSLNTVKFSMNPYNVNSMTAAAGLATLENQEYTAKNVAAIVKNREYTTEKLRELGFEVSDSSTNFVFAKHPEISGEEIYLSLREKGILVRHFTPQKIKDYNRISIGTREQMEALITALKEITEEYYEISDN